MSEKNQAYHFMSDISSLLSGEGVPQDLELGETYPVEIPIFREGTFEHPWYGKLVFDREYLHKMIENHKAGVVPQAVSFDVSHRPDGGAIAWIEDRENGLSVREKTYSTPTGQKSLAVLYAKVELNQRGFRLIKGKEFRYFSSEIDSDFTTSEVHVVQTGHGQAETVITHGVTLVGGGITNRPFIPGLGQIEFSTPTGEKMQVQDGISCSDLDKIDGCFLFSTGGRAGETKGEIAAPVVATSPIVNENNGVIDTPNSNDGDGMKFTELLKKIETFSSTKEQVEFMKTVQSQMVEDDKGIFDVLLKAKEQAFSATAQAEDAIQRKVSAEREAEAARLANLTLSNDLAEAREGSWKSQVQIYCDGLRKEKHHESAIKTVENLLSNLKAGDRAQKFSMIDGQESKDVGLIDILTQVFASLPSSARLDLDENLQAHVTTEVTPVAPVTPVAKDPAPEIAVPATFSAPDASEPAPATDAKIDKFVARYGYKPDAGIYDLIQEDGTLKV